MSEFVAPISVREAQSRRDLVVGAIAIPGVSVELCAFPETQAETLVVVETQSVLSLGLSRLLEAAEGRFPAAQTPRFTRFGSLNFRPQGVPMEARVSRGSYHTIRCRFDADVLRDASIDPAALDAAQLEACFDIHAPRIEDALMRLAEEVADPAPDSAALVSGLVGVVLVDLARFLTDAPGRTPRCGGGLAPRHLRLVFARIDEPGPLVRISELAELCGLSRYHFMRAFRESVGESPGAYARRVHMSRARALLVSGNRPIHEVAMELGYSSAAAFSAAFRRDCGRSPRAWRACLR